jgi:hypothetical protein
MIWGSDTIVRAILATLNAGANEGDFEFPLYDARRMVGVGVNTSGELVLMLPPQPDADGFEAKHANYVPYVNLIQPTELPQVVARSLINCKFDADDLGQIQAISSLFAGLISLERSVSNTASAIWAMKSLFESGFVYKPSKETIKGLLGELAVLNDYQFADETVRAWHSDPMSKFDLSHGNLRLEVKTTSGASREHRFSQGQVPGPQNVRTFVASVLLQVVESGGISLCDFLLKIKSSVAPDVFNGILAKASEYVKCNPFSVNEPRFDLHGTLNNIRYFKAELVPHPAIAQGVSELTWKAALQGVEHEELRPSFN